MPISSKKKADAELDIRVRVLEKLVDKLMDKVDLLSVSVKGSDATIKDVLELVAKVQTSNTDDGWDVPPEVPETPKDPKEKGSHEQDEVKQMIYS